MTSILKVDSIQNAAGTAAMTIDSGGKVTGSVNDSRQCAMGFMRTAGLSGNADPVSGFTNIATQLSGDSAGQITRGGSVTDSSGTFSFPFTGLWSVEFCTSISAGAQDDTIQVDILTTTDNSSYSSFVQAKGGAGSANRKECITLKGLFNVTNTSNDKVRFKISSNSGTAEGETGTAMTYCIFTWLGDAD